MSQPPSQPTHGPTEKSVVIDCDTCVVRGAACGDCVVSVLLSRPPTGVRLDHDERVAIGVLAASGLVPPLRLVTSASANTEDDAEAVAEAGPATQLGEGSRRPLPPTMTG